MRGPSAARPGQRAMLWVIPLAGIAVAGLAVATGGWLLGPAGRAERLLMAAGGLALLYTEPLFVAAGLSAIVAGLAVHLVRRRARLEVAT